MSPRHPELQRLGRRIAVEQDQLLAHDLGPRGLRQGRVRRPNRTARWLMAAAVVASLGALGAIVLLRTHALGMTVAGERGAPGAWIAAPHDASVPIRFSEGTEITLEPEASARVLEVTNRGAHLTLESGTAKVRVTPNRSRHWTLSAGPYNVEVKGTRFDMGWSPRDEVLTLVLAEGTVSVSGCALGEARSLFAGETLRASCRDQDFRIARTAQLSPPPAATQTGLSEPPAPVPARDGVAVIPPSTPSARQSSAASESWQTLARASKFKDAFERVKDRGFDAELAKAGPDDLLLLGDVARLSDDSSHALRAYQRVRSRAPGTPWASSAAFSIGRVYFDQRDSYTDAARWFATYLSEEAQGPLAREALGRRMEALSRSGDRTQAAQVAEQYLVQFPNGPHAPLAKTLRSGPN